MKKTEHRPSFRFNRDDLSLARRGAWGQVLIASVLITFLPGLLLAWLWQSHLEGAVLLPVTIWSVCCGGLVLIVLGYSLLLKYPINIIRLRSCLSTLAEGKIPDFVALSKDEDDLAAVQRYMETIVKMAEEHIRMLKAQYEVKLEADRQRIMIESIGAMCHHLGQPATVLSMCLYALKNNPSSEDAPRILADCETAFNAMAETLDKLRTTVNYRSESYLDPEGENKGAPQECADRIIKI